MCIRDRDKDPAAVVEERGMKQVSDTGAIEAVVDAVLAANPDKVAQYQGGKTGLIGFFVGQCMKEMRGQGNPKPVSYTHLPRGSRARPLRRTRVRLQPSAIAPFAQNRGDQKAAVLLLRRVLQRLPLREGGGFFVLAHDV